MTWTKLRSEFYDDSTMLSVSRGARLLHVEALCWCNRQGTDGHVRADRLGRITDEPDPRRAVDELVHAGAWTATPNGWQIVGFLDDQPTAADVARTQALARERQRRQRQHRGGDHSLCDPRHCHASRVTDGVTSRVTNGVSHDTRTEPSRAVKAKAREGAHGSGNGRPDRRPWCGRCSDEHGRWLLDENGQRSSTHCPSCYPPAGDGERQERIEESPH